VPTGALGRHMPDLANGETMFLIGGCSSCHAVPKQENSMGLKRVGREMRMLVENADDQTPADPSLLRIIARAHHIHSS
jgi:hypothetical protein